MSYKRRLTSSGLALGVAFMMACAMVLSVFPTFAVDLDGYFELGPGELTDEDSATNILGDGMDETGPDWADIFDANGDKKPAAIATFGGLDAGFILDDLATKGLVDNTVFSQSNKNGDLINSWNWDTGNVPNKDDVTNGYAYAVVDDNGDYRIYAGVERIDASGDSHVDMEFNQKPVTLDKTPPCGDDGTDGPGDTAPCEFIGQKTAGDLVISMDFLKGGTLGTLTVHEWDGTQFVDIVTLNGEGCNPENGLPEDTVCAFNNGAIINGGPWPNFGKGGAPTNMLLPNAFTEFGLNVSQALGLEITPCFATISLKTRSSQSFTAELKDFGLASFQQCSAMVTTEIHKKGEHDTDIQKTTVPVGTEIHDQATVTGIAGFEFPMGKVTFNLYADTTCGNDSGGTVIKTQEVNLPGNATVQKVETSDYATTASGGLSYKATYSGDDNYPEATAECEPLTVAKINVVVTTRVRSNEARNITDTAVDIGTMVQDVATITAAGAPDPTGDVTFRKYPNAGCLGDVFTEETITISDDGVADGVATALSTAFTANAESFHSYLVIYGGDSVYNSSVATHCEPICVFDFSPSTSSTSSP